MKKYFHLSDNTDEVLVGDKTALPVAMISCGSILDPEVSQIVEAVPRLLSEG